MYYDRDFIAGKLRSWEKYLRAFRLPAWEDIPNLGLYMDQVVFLLTEYLDYLPPEIKEERFITAATINNYVRMKAMPEPVKKKYYRVHIAYLIMICTLKQTLSIATLHGFIPTGIPEEEVRTIYTSYVQRHTATAEMFVEQIRLAAAPILDPPRVSAGRDATQQTSDLIASSAIAGGFARVLAEKLLLLEGLTLEIEEGSVAEPAEVPEQGRK